MKHLVAVIALVASLAACGSDGNDNACTMWQQADTAFQNAAEADRPEARANVDLAVDAAIKSATGDVRESFVFLKRALSASPMVEDDVVSAMQLVAMRCPH